jgi:hypothetical protein
MSHVQIDELNPETRAKGPQQIGETEGGSPTPSPSTAIVKYEKSEIISAFSNLMEITDADELTDTALFNCMRDGLRITVQILSPLCVSFMKRFKTAKRNGKDFHGYTDFDRAAERLTGYSGRQVRNLAAGTPTPIKKAAVKQLTPAEKLARHEAQKLQDKIDLATAQAVAARNASNAESQAALAKMPSASPVLPVVPFSQQDANELKERRAAAAVKETARLDDAEETDALLDYILKSVKLGTAPSIAVSNKIYSLAEKIRFHRERKQVA